MRRLCIFVLSFAAMLLPLRLSAQMQVPGLDSALTAALDSKLDEYFAALEPLPASAKIEECDFILESCEDSLIRQYTAVRIYDHFLGSKVMGDEAVSVHMVDDWFTPGKTSMYSDLDLLNAQVYASFHRNSLIGMPAPVLTMLTTEGTSETVPKKGDVSILFFYDTSCSKCRLETMRLKPVLEDLTFPVEFYAIYVSVFDDEWEKYREERWDFEPENVRIHHLWDPDLDSDFQMQYGVLQTPQMLLVDRDGMIIGRGLDSEALVKLLPAVAPDDYEYGAPDSYGLFEALFNDSDPSAADILELAGYIKDQTVARGDSVLCRHMLGDFLFYLMDTPGEEYKLALNAFIGAFIDSDPAMWQDKHSYDSVVRPAAMMKEMLARVPVGSRIPKLKVKGVLAGDDPDYEHPKSYRLRRLHGDPSYVVFHSPGCASCEAVLEAVPYVLKEEPGAKVLLVDPDLNGRELLDIFDLSVLPHVIKLDKKGNVTGKYLIFE